MKLYWCLVLVLISIAAKGQEMDKNFNLILVFNESIVVEYKMLEIISYNSSEVVISKVSGTYLPGLFKLPQDKYDSLRSDDNIKELKISFKEYLNDEVLSLLVEIPFSSKWLDYDFLIIKIYDLTNTDYKDQFEPLSKDRNYTFELIYPGGQLLRLRN